jgi:hypothetical protein
MKAAICFFAIMFVVACESTSQRAREACAGKTSPFSEIRTSAFDSVCFNDAVVYIGFHESGIAPPERLSREDDLPPLRIGFDESCPESVRMRNRLEKTKSAVISGTGYLRPDGMFMVQCVFDVKPIKLTDRQKRYMTPL